MIIHILPIISLFVLPIQTEELPTNVVPTHYDVDLTIDTKEIVRGVIALYGTVCIKFFCNGNVKEIQLHAKLKHVKITDNDEKKMTIKLLDNDSSQQIVINNKAYNEKNDILTLQTTPLSSTKPYELCIPFTGGISEENGYIIWRNKEKSSEQYIIATNFQRQSAFPCFDEPALKATFAVKLNVKPHEKTYSNSPSTRDKETQKNGWAVDVYKLTNKLSPSQISFVVTNVDFWSYKYSFSRQWEAKFMCTKVVYNRINLQNKFPRFVTSTELGGLGPFFTSLKVKFIVIPTDKTILSFNWGLVLMRESDFNNASPDRRVYSIYQRMASQWFGGMVSPDSWDSNWMYNVLASYVALLKMKKQPYIIKEVTWLMWRDQPDDLEGNMINGIDPFQYKQVGWRKGKMLMRMIHLALGTKAFYNALDNFVKKYQFSSAGPNQLWEVFSKDSLPYGITWTNVMETWKKKGYPVVTVESIGNGEFLLSQEPIRQRRQNTDADCWIFPLTYTSANNVNFKVKHSTSKDWLECGINKVLSVTTVGDWVIFNLNYAGLYRVKYDDASWELIVSALKSKPGDFDPNIRAQLVNDSLAVSWLGHQDYLYTFKLLPFLRTETDDVVWTAFFVGASNLKAILETSPETYRRFVDFFSSFLNPAFQNIYKERKNLFDPLENSSKVVSKVEALLYSWACNLGRLEICRTQAISKFDYWRSTSKISAEVGNYRFSRSLLSTVFCIVIDTREGSDDELKGEEWIKRSKFFLDYLLNIDYGQDDYRVMFIDALTCVSDRNTLNVILEWATTPKDDIASKEDKRRGFLELARGQNSFSPTLDYFYNNIEQIQSYYESDDVLARFVYALTSKMNKDQLNTMENFIKKTPLLSDEKVSHSFNKGEAVAKLKIQWLEENEPKIRDALNKLSF